MPPFDRDRWEATVLSSDLQPYARLVALALAHSAGPAGYLPVDGPQKAPRLAERTGLNIKQTRVSLKVLEVTGFIERPDLTTWQPQQAARPITLVHPTPATRTEPAHPEAER
ncbi:hypothetical protein ABZ313_29825 [Streptomyces sp. NPDC006251]|uniref:hypothetical protein n=1 Tax=Streptomyces sp. NPDC006251 TaxID=3155718 RepID=UPI0033AE07E8